LGNSGGYLLQALALGLGPLVIVQPLIVTSLMVTSLLFALSLAASW
jgi:hypothetical protein